MEKVSFVYIKDGKETHKVYLNDIQYIESAKDQIIIHLPAKSINT